MTVLDEPRAGSAAVAGRGWSATLAAGWPTTASVPDLDREPSAAARITAAARLVAALPIPEDFGGGGGTLLDAAAAQRILGAVDPSVAIALNMHTLSVGLLVEHWRRRRDTSWMLMEAVATGDHLVGSAFAEPGGSANILRSRTTAVATSAGYRLTGTKFPCSLATTAAMFCLSAQVEGTDTAIVALCPADAPGLRVAGSWDSIGMRSSDTAGLELDGVELDRRLVFHEAPVGAVDDVVVGGLIWFVVLVSATYHGVLTSLVELAATTSRLPARRSESALAEATEELLVFGSAAQGLARTWTDDAIEGSDALVAAAALRLRLSATVDRVVSGLRPLLGAAAYTRGTTASDRVIDALAAHHHPPSIALSEALLVAAGSGRSLVLDLQP